MSFLFSSFVVVDGFRVALKYFHQMMLDSFTQLACASILIKQVPPKTLLYLIFLVQKANKNLNSKQIFENVEIYINSSTHSLRNGIDF